MKIRYQITQDDYKGAMDLVWRRSIRDYMFFGLLLLVLFSIGFINGFDKWLVAILVILICYLLFVFPILKVLITQRNFDENKGDIIQMRSIELQEGGLFMSTESAQQFLRWGKIKKWRENKNIILIYAIPFVVHIIPKKLLDQGFNIEKLTVHLTDHIGPKS